MDEIKEEKCRRLSMPADAADKLLDLKGERDWVKFVATLESKFRPNRISNPSKYYFNRHLEDMHLTENQVCRLCRRRTLNPQKLKIVDYPATLYQMFEDSFKKANIDIDGVRRFFVVQNMQQKVPACVHCKAYQGQKPPDDFAWNILNSNGPFAAELIEPQISFRLEQLTANKK